MEKAQFEKLIRLIEELQKGQKLDMRGGRGYSVAHPHLRKQNKPGYGKMNKYEDAETDTPPPQKVPVEVSRVYAKKDTNNG